jgi:hypothetical protein
MIRKESVSIVLQTSQNATATRFDSSSLTTTTTTNERQLNIIDDNDNHLIGIVWSMIARHTPPRSVAIQRQLQNETNDDQYYTFDICFCILCTARQSPADAT